MKKLIVLLSLGLVGHLYGDQGLESVATDKFVMLCTTVPAPLNELNALTTLRLSDGQLWWDFQEKALGVSAYSRLNRDFDFIAGNNLYKKCRLYLKP